jgi:hypothetical protein
LDQACFLTWAKNLPVLRNKSFAKTFYGSHQICGIPARQEPIIEPQRTRSF